MAAIRQWSARRREADPDGRAVRARVEAELAPYLGPGGASRTLEPAADRHKLLPAVESVLTIFLGGRAAGRLMRRVVDRAVVRI
jgi:hypothetical protein